MDPELSGSFSTAFRGHWFDFQRGRLLYTLLMRPNKVKTAVQLFHMLHVVLAGFSGHGNSIYNIIPLLKNKKCMST